MEVKKGERNNIKDNNKSQTVFVQFFNPRRSISSLT